MPDAEKMVAKFYANWGNSSAEESKRVLVDSDAEIVGLFGFAGDPLQRCDVCRAFGNAPLPPTAGAPMAPPYKRNRQVDFPP